jgi:hypothetical protein
MVFVAHIAATPGGGSLDSLTFGGTSCTALTSSYEDASSSPTKRLYTRVWYLKEANIPAGSQTVDLTHSGIGLPVELITIFTLFNFDQNSTPYFENPPTVNTTIATAAKQVTATYGANSGKFAVSICMNRSGDYNFFTGNGTISNTTGAQVGLYSANAANYVATKTVKIDSLADNSQTDVYTVDYDDSATTSNGHPVIKTFALVFDEVGATPVLTIDQASIEPGGTISGSYSGFQIGTPPTTPISISDGTNTITTAVTITPTNPDDGTGTFTGTLPTLPTAGNSGSFVLFGNVTATLDDA